MDWSANISGLTILEILEKQPVTASYFYYRANLHDGKKLLSVKSHDFFKRTLDTLRLLCRLVAAGLCFNLEDIHLIKSD